MQQVAVQLLDELCFAILPLTPKNDLMMVATTTRKMQEPVRGGGGDFEVSWSPEFHLVNFDGTDEADNGTGRH